MTQQEIQEQLQNDILSIIDGFNIEKLMKSNDYEKMKNAICDCILKNIKNN
jgi:hypothetical protein